MWVVWVVRGGSVMSGGGCGGWGSFGSGFGGGDVKSNSRTLRHVRDVSSGRVVMLVYMEVLRVAARGTEVT